MSECKIDQPIAIAELIRAIRSGDILIDNFCVFAKEDIDEITLDLICYLSDYPEVVDDQDVYSEYVRSHGLQLVYYGQQFQDVLTNFYRQNEAATMEDVVLALNYYMDNDDFLDIL